jgi:hypothetical protein
MAALPWLVATLKEAMRLPALPPAAPPAVPDLNVTLRPRGGVRLRPTGR